MVYLLIARKGISDTEYRERGGVTARFRLTLLLLITSALVTAATSGLVTAWCWLGVGFRLRLILRLLL